MQSAKNFASKLCFKCHKRICTCHKPKLPKFNEKAPAAAKLLGITSYYTSQTIWLCRNGLIGSQSREYLLQILMDVSTQISRGDIVYYDTLGQDLPWKNLTYEDLTTGKMKRKSNQILIVKPKEIPKMTQEMSDELQEPAVEPRKNKHSIITDH